jgi:hypothetical protein
MAPTHENSGKAAFHAKEQHAKKRERNHAAEPAEQLIFTVNAATGVITKIEKVDARGKHREIAQEETLALTDKDSLHEIEATLDEAFEAGITSVLEPDSRGLDPEASSPEDSELRHAVLEEIIQPSVRRRLQRRLVQRLLLSKALAH